MSKRFVAAALFAIVAGAFVSAQAPYKAPRTPWGDPDLSGVYSNDDETGTPLERPAEFEGRRLEDITPDELKKINEQRTEQFNAGVAGTEFAGGLRPPTHLIFDPFVRKNSRAWLITEPSNGRVPALTFEALERLKRPQRGVSTNANPVGPFDSYLDMGLYDRCITRGIPGSMMPAIYGNAYEILQGPGYVAIQYEMVHETRIIPLGGQPHPGPNIKLYMGDAKGHWDGNTLVVETTNFTERTAYRGSSEYLKIIERFTPTSPETVEWSSTFDDPHTWTRPWTFAMNLTKKDASQRPFEYACHEGNYGMVGMLDAARAEEKAGAAVNSPRDAEGER